MQRPDERGYFGGKFGGKFVHEVLVEALAQLERGMDDAFADPAFWDEYGAILRDYVGRPSPLTEAPRFVDDPQAAPALSGQGGSVQVDAYAPGHRVIGPEVALAVRSGRAAAAG